MVKKTHAIEDTLLISLYVDMKSIYSSAHYFLVHKLRLSNKEALRLIESKTLYINGEFATTKQEILPEDEVVLNGEVVKERQELIYLLYYKPRGIESTMNPTIPHNLMEAGQFPSSVFPVGRLDKASEGLLLLTNDGSIYNKIVAGEQEQEKEYLVKVDGMITEEFLTKMSSGIEILGQMTKPAKVEILSESSFTITLTQGLNKQIRRMCKTLGYQVTFLLRSRIINLHLENLPSGTWRHLTKEELKELKHRISFPIIHNPSKSES